VQAPVSPAPSVDLVEEPAEDPMARLDPNGLLSAPVEESGPAGATAADPAGSSLEHAGDRGRFTAQLPEDSGPVQSQQRPLKGSGEPMTWSGYRSRISGDDGAVGAYMLWHYDVAPYLLDDDDEEEWLRGLATDALHEVKDPVLDEAVFSVAGRSWLRVDFEGSSRGEPVGGRVIVARITPRDVVVMQAVGSEEAAGSSPEALAFFRSFEHDAAGTPTPGPSCRQRSSGGTTVRAVAPAEIPRRVRHSQGCVVLLEYYASWCPACRAAMPQVSALAERWRPHGLAVHAFAGRTGGDELAQLVRDVRPAYEPLQLEAYDPGEVTAAIGQLGASYPGKIPWFALFDTEGRLVWEGSGGGGLDEVEDRLPGLLR
jgi:thiol-disulfide isomerase/thioredoxin